MKTRMPSGGLVDSSASSRIIRFIVAAGRSIAAQMLLTRLGKRSLARNDKKKNASALVSVQPNTCRQRYKYCMCQYKFFLC